MPLQDTRAGGSTGGYDGIGGFGQKQGCGRRVTDAATVNSGHRRPAELLARSFAGQRWPNIENRNMNGVGGESACCDTPLCEDHGGVSRFCWRSATWAVAPPQRIKCTLHEHAIAAVSISLAFAAALISHKKQIETIRRKFSFFNEIPYN